MQVNGYRPRVVDEQLDVYLRTFGAVCVEGPKWCGKTFTGLKHASSAFYLEDPTGQYKNRQMAALDASFALSGEKPRLLDEWQEVPALWDAVRFQCDRDPAKGQYILTGSATPAKKGLHSGAGRIARLRMRTMSLFESGDSSGAVSLRTLCDGEIENQLVEEMTIKRITELILRGGWPASLELPLAEAFRVPYEYIHTIVTDDAGKMDGVERLQNRMWMLLRSLARNESSTVSITKLRSDVDGEDRWNLDAHTVKIYLDIFERLFLIENLPPYAPSLRSRIRVKQSEKRLFSDPSLAGALLRATPAMLSEDLETLGFLFEALCIRDLRIYAEAMDARVFHYQDYKGNEFDAVVERPDGRWCAFEVKLGAGPIESAAVKMRRIRDCIAKDNPSAAPSVLCVISGMSGAAYKREDGVFVVPLNALGP